MPFKFETANERMRYAGDLIQFPGQQQQQPEQNYKQLQIDFYNGCAQVLKAEQDLFVDPRYASLSEEEKKRLFDKAYNFIGSVAFTE
jgi:hypothetical protein